jgi:hypothetical protein
VSVDKTLTERNKNRNATKKIQNSSELIFLPRVSPCDGACRADSVLLTLVCEIPNLAWLAVIARIRQDRLQS